MVFKGIKKMSGKELSSLIEEKKKSRNTTFTWHMRNRHITLGFKQGSFFAYIKIKNAIVAQLNEQIPGIGDLLGDSLDPNYPKSYSYGDVPKRITEKGLGEEKNDNGIEMSYYIHGTIPLEVNEVERIPQKLNSTEDLYQLIKGKNRIFYTGAGISIQKVSGMDELKESLGIDATKNIDDLLINLLENPLKIKKKRSNFFSKMEDTQPSKAHICLAKIALKMDYKVMTENLDLLHQKTKINPIIPSTEFFELDKTNEIKELDFIVTVGLSHDDRGMLAYCKKINKNIKIISINPNIADYLSSQDYQLSEDCQLVLPYLENIIN